jgi:hypothetical protein
MRARLSVLCAAVLALAFGGSFALAEDELTGTLKKANDSGTLTNRLSR